MVDARKLREYNHDLAQENAALRELLNPEKIIQSCVPGGSICDPQEVADSIREYFRTSPSPIRTQTKTDYGNCIYQTTENLHRNKPVSG